MQPASAESAPANFFLWDRVPSRISRIRHALAESEAELRPLESLAEAEQAVMSEVPGVALVALGDSSAAQELALEVIRGFRQRSISVLAYEDGARSWPFGVRCRALLVGAQDVLDSTAGDFSDELRRRALAALQAGLRKRTEQKRIRDTLKIQGVVGTSPTMEAVCRLTLRVSGLSDLPVLLTGETGTGKELLARVIHRLDPKRCRGPFVAVNCAALTRSLAETELFGHRRGAFTGAEHDRKGLFRTAEGGVLFLDEITELILELQAKLLRALQENRVLGVGEDREVVVNARVIAATNQDLRERVARGEFRADLFHRLNVIPIHIPPLRERPEDVHDLVEHFIEKHQSLNPTRAIVAGPEFVAALQATALPGNARQVENVVRQAIARKEDDAPLGLADLPSELWQELCAPPAAQTKAVGPSEDMEHAVPPGEALFPAYLLRLLEETGWNLPRAIEHCEQLVLEAALHRSRGNQSETARLLGITPRSVYNKLRRRASRG